MIRPGPTLLLTATILTASPATRSLAQPYTIDTLRPIVVGNEFRIAGSTENTKQRHVTATGQAQPDLDTTTSLTYAYYVNVLEVKDGAPTRQRCTITRLILDNGEQKRSLLGAPPDVEAYVDNKGFTKIDVVSGTASDEALAALYDVIRLEPRKLRPEKLVASTEPRNVGETWAINPMLAVEFLAEENLNVQPGRMRATARLVSVETVSKITTLTLELKISSDNLNLQGIIPEFMRLTESGLQAVYTIVLPLDQSKPILSATSERTVTYVGVGGQKGVSVRANHMARMRESWTRAPVGD